MIQLSILTPTASPAPTADAGAAVGVAVPESPDFAALLAIEVGIAPPAGQEQPDVAASPADGTSGKPIAIADQASLPEGGKNLPPVLPVLAGPQPPAKPAANSREAPSAPSPERAGQPLPIRGHAPASFGSGLPPATGSRPRSAAPEDEEQTKPDLPADPASTVAAPIRGEPLDLPETRPAPLHASEAENDHQSAPAAERPSAGPVIAPPATVAALPVSEARLGAALIPGDAARNRPITKAPALPRTFTPDPAEAARAAAQPVAVGPQPAAAPVRMQPAPISVPHQVPQAIARHPDQAPSPAVAAPVRPVESAPAASLPIRIAFALGQPVRRAAPIDQFVPANQELASSLPLAAPVAPQAIDPAMPAATAPPLPPRDFAALIDRLVVAREAAQPHPVSLSLNHSDFGPVRLRFTHDDAGLSVALASSNPEFGRAAALALPVVAASAAADSSAGQSPAAPRSNGASGSASEGTASGQGGATPRRDDRPAPGATHRSDRPSARGRPVQDGIFA